MMTTRRITADEARALLACWSGDQWDTDAMARLTVNDAALIKAAPDLAASVIALEAERDRCLDGVNRLLDAQREDSARLVAERDAALREAVSRHDDAHRARQARDEALAEVERLRAIIEGRTTPPTDAEIDAHAAAGGSWAVIVTSPSGAICTMLPSDPRMVRDVRDGEVMIRGEAKTWRALDAQRRPCAWPTVTP